MIYPSSRRLLRDGSQYGIQLHYRAQPKPEGIAQAFLLGEDFIAGNPCALVLGDNIFYGHDLAKDLAGIASKRLKGQGFSLIRCMIRNATAWLNSMQTGKL